MYPTPPQTSVPKNFRWCRWGAERWVKRAQTQERGPLSAPAEILTTKNKRKTWQGVLENLKGELGVTELKIIYIDVHFIKKHVYTK